MRISFQADADLNPEFERGLRRREPAVDFGGAAGVIPNGATDPEVLQIAAESGRMLVSRVGIGVVVDCHLAALAGQLQRDALADAFREPRVATSTKPVGRAV